MPSQEQIDQEAGGSDLENRVAVLEDTIATLRRNLLEPAMTRPGTLRFGANIMQLDNNGIQVATTSGVSAFPALYVVPSLTPTPGDSGPYATLAGYAVPQSGNDVAKFQIESHGETGKDAIVGTQVFGIPDFVTSYLIASYSGSDASFILGIGGTNGRASLSNALLNIASFASDPASLSDGDVWYNSTANKLYARINGATVELGAATTVATDTIWNAAGDLAVGTGADTATVLSGSSEDSYYLRYSTAINSPVWYPWLKVSNQTGDFSASGGFFYRVSGTTTVTMPLANIDGRVMRIINVGSGNVTVNRTSSDTFFYGTTGLTSHSILPGECFTYTAYAGGTEWLVS